MNDRHPHTEFDWLIYADATFAGLSTLIPIPLVDSAFEWIFRRRMPRVIARRRGQTLETAVLNELNRSRRGCRQGCLLMLPLLAFELLKRISRKILYFLTVKEASDQLSRYWHRAFLIDYMITAGYLSSTDQSHIAAMTLEEMLNEPDISPLNQLAQQITGGARHIFRTLRGARRGQEDEVVDETRSLMARTWDNFEEYWQELAAEYDQGFQRTAARLTAEAQAKETMAAVEEEE